MKHCRLIIEIGNSLKTTDGTLLGGRVGFRQPEQGYRAAIDPVLLAAACPVEHGMKVADLGCGAGAASLSVAWRCPGIRITAIERERSLLKLLSHNVETNGFSSRITPIEFDIRSLQSADIGGPADLIMTNPPFLAEGAYTHSQNQIKLAANSEGDTPLSEWIAAARRLSRDKTKLVMIHRADRLTDILAGLQASFGEIRVFPIWPKTGQAAKRIIVSAVFGSKAPLKIAPGLTIHGSDGSFSQAAEAILRDGERLLIVA